MRYDIQNGGVCLHTLDLVHTSSSRTENSIAKVQQDQVQRYIEVSILVEIQDHKSTKARVSCPNATTEDVETPRIAGALDRERRLRGNRRNQKWGRQQKQPPFGVGTATTEADADEDGNPRKVIRDIVIHNNFHYGSIDDDTLCASSPAPLGVFLPTQ